MRINRFIALATGIGRRAADAAVEDGRVRVNGETVRLATQIQQTDHVTIDGKVVSIPEASTTILLNKPVGYVVSRQGQGSKTIYDLLPQGLHHLKPIGRLDKESSGLLLLSNDGQLAHQLTHPSFQKIKVYEARLDQPLQPLHRQMIGEMGIRLDDGFSKLGLERLEEGNDQVWRVTMHEGRNRQIRRTFSALGYGVNRLHRTVFGNYNISDVPTGGYKLL